ncbi:hypothetical protein TNCV_4313381 [Trichonephila clavipes]|nr:hypothetical protein TNCV_4313381 [Trichonephila clavipes]
MANNQSVRRHLDAFTRGLASAGCVSGSEFEKLRYCRSIVSDKFLGRPFTGWHRRLFGILYLVIGSDSFLWQRFIFHNQKQNFR